MTNKYPAEDRSAYANLIADSSYDWYKTHAIRARRAYKLTEIAVIAISAAVPATLAIDPDQTTIVALLGAVIVIISGLRSVYHWQDDYLRFSQAREAVEAQRRLYQMGRGRYATPETRDAVLVEAVTSIEEQELHQWVTIATRPPDGASRTVPPVETPFSKH